MSITKNGGTEKMVRGTIVRGDFSEWRFTKILYDGEDPPNKGNPVRSFKNYENDNQGHVVSLMSSSYFNTVTEIDYFYE